LADSIGIIGTLTSQDAVAQSSTQNHLGFLLEAPRLVLHQYPIVGTGPGSQNGPGGPGGDTEKVASDFLWLGFLVDFGTLIGAILVLFRVILLVYLLYRAYRFRGSGSTASITAALTLMFLLASVVDSAYAHPVTVSIFYVVAGIFLYKDSADRLDAPMQPAAA
jgi:hypothetical protein